MNRGLRLTLLSSLISTGTLLLGVDALAQDEPEAPPTVSDTEAGPIQENQTVAAEVEEGSERPEGWTPGIAFGAGFNLVDNRAVVGQQDGTTLTLSGGLDAVLDFNHGMHEWRNGLLGSAGVARTPSIGEFVKTNDGLSFESIYLLHVIEIFGPFARFGLNTQMFSANDIQPAPVDYVVSNLDGTTDSFTGRRLALTDPFQPLNLRQSVGVFVQPIRKQEIELEARAGLGAMETFAEGGLAINDDDSTPEVEVNELDDSYLVGGEMVVNAWGFLDPGKRISYSVGGSVLIPFVTSDLPEDDDRNLIDLTTIEARAGLNVKLFDWASLNYKLAVLRQPLLVEDVQISNSLLLTIGAAFGSKAPTEPEPPPCDCEEAPLEEAVEGEGTVDDGTEATAAEGAEAGVDGAASGGDVDGPAAPPEEARPTGAPPVPEPAPEPEPAPAPAPAPEEQPAPQPEPAPEPNP